ncbi:hypothetical protein WJX72_010127 [[Myrmecia] bisecta]|uniref:KATNIP domain-containing protein n=1 Tax=[Myrmecia] bisecta TaxID=41462 RepID=A0AAW1R9G5_9CHLO
MAAQVMRPAAPDQEAFVIPKTPFGQVLELAILTTWGDPHYVGLSSIEIFDSSGQLLRVNHPLAQVQAEPASINVLDAYCNDPRTPDNLLDGHAMTCDDLHVWLAPFTPGLRHTVTIRLDAPAALGCVRIWNYNKSRIHSSRGARHVELLLDGAKIFCGEIQRAPGNLPEAPAAAECVLFTEEEAALSCIDAFDQVYFRAQRDASQAEEQSSLPAEPAQPTHRAMLDLITSDSDAELGWAAGQRPMTSATRSRPAPTGISLSQAPDLGVRWFGREVRLVILGTWGDENYVGMTGVQVLGAHGQPLPLRPADITADPRDLNDLPGCCSDERTVDKLLDGIDQTMDDAHMWLAPLRHLVPGRPGAPDCNTVTISLGSTEVEITAIRICNYNKSRDDTQRGVKRMLVLVDGCNASPPGGFLVRKAPGTAVFDFGHVLMLSTSTAAGREDCGEASAWLSAMPDPEAALRCRQEAAKQPLSVQQDFLVPLLPSGFILKLLILSSWGGGGDFVGLTGLELHDAQAGRLSISPAQICAQPASVAEIAGMQADVRTPDKLVDGVNTTSAAHSWLAPLGENDNTVFVHMQSPFLLSLVRLWNYSKTPCRGARDVELYLDDQLIYKGVLRQAAQDCVLPQAILFTSDPAVVREQQQFVYCHAACPSPEQAVMLINDHQLYSQRAEARAPVLPAARPTTAIMV